MTNKPELESDPILEVLRQGAMTLKGEFVWGSNYTFLAEIQTQAEPVLCVYKPAQGERQLWDFPDATLGCREVAAYLVSQALSWKLVPATVYRQEAPYGPGSVQLFIEHDPDYHYFSLSEEDHQRLRPVALFDLIVNNADRKGSHILFDKDRHIWLIDHGICFHAENKLRTVVWDFGGEQFSAELLEGLCLLRDQLSRANELRGELEELLSPEEVLALARRIERLMNRGAFPNPHPSQRPYPWPPV